MKLKHPQQQGHFCYAIYTAEEAVYSASGLKWSSTRNFQKKLSLQKESPIENHQVASLNCHPCYQITDRAGKWETVLSHRYSSTQRSRIHHGSVGKTQSKPKVTLRLWWRADSSRVPLHSFVFLLEVYLCTLQNTSRSLRSALFYILPPGLQKAASEVMPAYFGVLHNCPRQAHKQHVRTHDAFPNQPSLLDLTWTAALVQNCRKRTLVGNLRSKWLTAAQGSVHLDQVYP